MKKEIEELINKGKENLEAAKLLRDKKFLDIAISRCYYAMLYASEAVLLTKDLRFSKHQAVIAAFGRHFAKPEILDKRLHRYLLDAFEERLESDYGPFGTIEEEMVNERLLQTEKFLKEVEIFLGGEENA